MENLSQDTNKDLIFNICILGDSNVGKTSIITRLVDNVFLSNSTSTIGVDFRICKVEYQKDKFCTFQIWDTAGQERFRSSTYNYLKKAHGFIYVYDITKKETFHSIIKWIDIVNDSTNLIKTKGNSKFSLLIGNKCDLSIFKRDVDISKATELAISNKMLFMETSALENINIKQAFIQLAEELVNGYSENIDFQYQMRGPITSRLSINLNEDLSNKFKYIHTNKQNKKCC